MTYCCSRHTVSAIKHYFMKKSLVLIVFVFWALTVPAAGTVPPDTLAARMWRQVMAFPQEKLYAQTDRAEYTCGDTIWVRHHVANATTLVPTRASRYVYVELVNPLGKLVCRQMMRQDEGGDIYGYVPTAFDLPAGLYTLRAYTRYMAATTPEYVFERPVRILSSVYNPVRIVASVKGGTVRLSFTEPKSGKPVHGGSIRVSSADGEMAFTGSSDKGVSLHSVDMGANRGCLLVEVGNYSEFVTMDKDGIDLQLMPEGGQLVMGRRCRVAYKTVAEDGLGIDMKATVTDDMGNVVAESGATHRGMGMFYITAQPGRTYKVTCVAADGQTCVAKMPEAKTGACALSVTQTGNKVIAGIVGFDVTQATGKLWLVVHQGGAPLYAKVVESGSVSFARGMFHDGIAHFMLADDMMRIISERMVFVWNGHSACGEEATVETRDDGGRRTVSIVLPDTIDASCAVSIADAGRSCADTVQNIVSALLLSQELRGYVEQPAWYFAERGRSGQLDLLMMTQGWRRYDMGEVLVGNVRKPSAVPEKSMRVSGKVTSNMTPRGRKDARVVMTSNRGGMAGETVTGDDGRFSFDGFEMPDSTGYILQARSAKGSYNNVVRVDSISYPEITSAIPQTRGVATQVMAGDGRRTEVDGGGIVFLPEVTVTERHRPKTEYESLAKVSGRSVTDEMLKGEGNKSVFSFLKGAYYLGLTYDFNNEWFFYHTVPSYLVIDGTLWSLSSYTALTMVSILESIRVSDVLQIDIIKGAVTGTLPTLAGVGALDMSSSAIVVTTKKDGKRANTDVAFVRPLGYQRPAEFYNPRHAAPEGYRLRRTVYWNPSLRVVGGKATLSFLPNGAESYRLVVEGVGSQGRLVRVSREIML